MVGARAFLAGCLAVTFLTAANGQRMLGVATGNWSGMTDIYLDPSCIADNRAQLVAGLAAGNAYVDNSLGSVSLQKISNSGSFNQAFTLSNNATFNILAAVEIHGPGIMYSVNDNNAMAITTRLRVFNQFSNFDQKLFQTLTNPLYASNNYSLTSSHFNWTIHLWNEINLTYAHVFYNDNVQFIKGGITLGKIGGIGYMGIKGDNLNATYDPATQSLQATNSDVEFASNVINDANKLQNGVSNVLGELFGQGGGTGFRGDIGLTYEYREDNQDNYFERFDATANKYKARVSVAVTDFGTVKYKDDLLVNITGNGTLTEKGLTGNFSDASKFTSYINSQGFHLDTPHANVKVYLPTAIVLGIDYHVWRQIYVNGTWISNLATRLNFGNSYYGQFSIIPRWDTKIFTGALPITYSNLSHSLKYGFGMRVGGFFMGSDDVGLLFGGNGYGGNFYAGAFIPIQKKYRQRVFGT